MNFLLLYLLFFCFVCSRGGRCVSCHVLWLIGSSLERPLTHSLPSASVPQSDHSCKQCLWSRRMCTPKASTSRTRRKSSVSTFTLAPSAAVVPSPLPCTLSWAAASRFACVPLFGVAIAPFWRHSAGPKVFGIPAVRP